MEAAAERRPVEAPPIAPEIDDVAPDNTIRYREYHDSPTKKPLAPGKRHHTERFRISQTRIDRWTSAKAAYIGYLTGRGYTSVDIAKIMNDGTSKETVRGQWRRWGLPRAEIDGTRCTIVPVPLFTGTRKRLSKCAAKVGCAPDEFLRRIIVSVVEDDLYVAVTDGRFDPKPAKTKTAT
ncbi:hypothetical protein [Mesorhizobium sp. A556]